MSDQRKRTNNEVKYARPRDIQEKSSESKADTGSESTADSKPVSAFLSSVGNKGKEYANTAGFYGIWVSVIIGYIVFAVLYGQSLETKSSVEHLTYISVIVVWLLIAGGLYVKTKEYVGVLVVITVTLLYGILFSYGYARGYGIDNPDTNKWITITMSVGMMLFIFIAFGYTQWRLGLNEQSQQTEETKTVFQRLFDSWPTLKKTFILIFTLLIVCGLIIYSIVALDGNAFVATSVQFAILLLIGAGAVYTLHQATKKDKEKKNENWVKKGLVSLFGLGVFVFMGFITGRIGGIIASSLVGLFLAVTGLMSYQKVTKFTSWIQLVYDMILYIPCLLFDGFFEVYKQYRITPSYIYFILLIETLLIGAYFAVPYVIHWVTSKDGVIMLENPVYIDRLSMLEHKQLEQNIRTAINKQQKNFRLDKPTDTNQRNLLYTYGVSTWVYIDAQGANEKESTTRYSTVWDFGEKPIVEYNAQTNTIRVRVKTHEGMAVVYESKDADARKDTHKLPVKKSQVSIAENQKGGVFPLQRWNHVVVNADGGTMDVWINGVLVASKGNIVPMNVTDRFRIGENDGIQGGVKDVRFFTHPLSSDAIWRLSFE